MKAYAMTDIGRIRKINEDAYYMDPGCRGLFVVADGMGGHQAGEVASAMAVETLRDALLPRLEDASSGGELETVILNAVDAANDAIYQQAISRSNLNGMGTTVVLCLVKDAWAHVAHIGDSRAYLLRNGELVQLTEDHSLVQELLKKGRITEEEAADHPRKNILTRALGTDPAVQADFVRVALKPGDGLILCTDGISNHVAATELLEAVDGHGPEEACGRIVRLANERGGFDNMTIIIVKQDEGLEGAL